MERGEEERALILALALPPFDQLGLTRPGLLANLSFPKCERKMWAQSWLSLRITGSQAPP